MTDFLVILTGGAAPPPAASSGGSGLVITEDLIQITFLALLLVGVVVAAVLYVANVLDFPWRRAMSNTDRQAVLNGLMITGIAVLVGIYTLIEPGRLTSAADRQSEQSTHRGMLLYSQQCIGCHGIQGRGGPVPLDARKGDSAFAPPLAGRPDLRPKSKEEMALKTDFLRKVIERGRANTSMPSWSITEGGALNSQDIENLVDFIQRGEFADVPKVLGAENLAKAAATAVASGASLGSEGGPGKALFLSKGCAACHTIQGVSAGTVGPVLSKFGAAPQIAGVLANSKENVVKWILDPPSVKPGTAMPKLATLTADDADKLADYLESLK
ncbi:MAG: c-type cytochrome [Chloroflexota bacterium]|nr:MAG: c-type cytochrome [Chloroflexota bacterium]